MGWIGYVGSIPVTTPVASKTMFASTLASIVIIAMMKAHHAVSRIYGISRFYDLSPTSKHVRLLNHLTTSKLKF